MQEEQKQELKKNFIREMKVFIKRAIVIGITLLCISLVLLFGMMLEQSDRTSVSIMFGIVIGCICILLIGVAIVIAALVNAVISSYIRDEKLERLEKAVDIADKMDKTTDTDENNKFKRLLIQKIMEI